MLFQSFGFFVFFWVAFAVYWGLRAHQHRMGWLLAASIIFYALWNPWLIGLIAFTAGVDYLFALRIEAASNDRTRRGWLVASLVVSLSLLGFFKYTTFLLGAAGGLLGIFGIHFVPPAWHIVLPLGISFYTFETISYVVDVYRGRLRAERNVLHYALYIMFFPHLIAGPIVRPGQFLPQIRQRKRFDWQRFQFGAQIFMRGLLKKTVLADRLASVIDPVFRAPGGYSSSALWLAAIAYAGQIYCDFSGYSDMAIGAAHTFGFKLPQNFNRPYLADSIGEFWRRWHMTLSTWLRDYLYIPTGGNRGGNWRTYRNLLLTMGIAGLWHGAGWNFLIFGLMHGVAMALERALPQTSWAQWSPVRAVRIVATFLYWSLSLVFFRNATLASAGTMLARMFYPISGRTFTQDAACVAMIVLVVIFLGQIGGKPVWWRRIEARIPAPALGFAMACLFLLIQLLNAEYDSPFIYFQF